MEDKLDKPGYYRTESGNLLVMYPFRYKICAIDHFDIKENKWFTVFCTKFQLDLINKTLEYEYLGSL
jgi:hypothetical protein